MAGEGGGRGLHICCLCVAICTAGSSREHLDFAMFWMVPHTDFTYKDLDTACLLAWHALYRKSDLYILRNETARGLVPNFYIHVSVSDLYFPRISLPIWQRIYKSPM